MSVQLRSICQGVDMVQNDRPMIMVINSISLYLSDIKPLSVSETHFISLYLSV